MIDRLIDEAHMIAWSTIVRQWVLCDGLIDLQLLRGSSSRGDKPLALIASGRGFVIGCGLRFFFCFVSSSFRSFLSFLRFFSLCSPSFLCFFSFFSFLCFFLSFTRSSSRCFFSFRLGSSSLLSIGTTHTRGAGARLQAICLVRLVTFSSLLRNLHFTSSCFFLAHSLC